jgi:hypothetical protein
LVYGLYDPEGNKIGKIKRFIYTDGFEVVADHDYFDIVDPEFQGQGIATRFNAMLERFYRANGVDRIQLEANLDVGGYAWARAGYDFDGSYSVSKIADRFKGRLERGASDMEPATRDQIRSLLARVGTDNPPTPLEFAMVGWREGAATWLGKETMLGKEVSWSGVKRLDT